jgi:ribosome-associated protein
MVLATGTSPRQMKSVADDLQELGESRRNRALSRVGDESGQWIVVDFVDVVAHIFSGESRSFYDLDNLWGDAKIVEWEQPATPAKN